MCYSARLGKSNIKPLLILGPLITLIFASVLSDLCKASGLWGLGGRLGLWRCMSVVFCAYRVLMNNLTWVYLLAMHRNGFFTETEMKVLIIKFGLLNSLCCSGCHVLWWEMKPVVVKFASQYFSRIHFTYCYSSISFLVMVKCVHTALFSWIAYSHLCLK